MPDTVSFIVKKRTYPRKGPGRLCIAQKITDLVLHMVRKNISWGYDRIKGALANLGHIIAPNTLKNRLKRHGIEPTLEREKRTSWKTFLKAHWGVMSATDLFTVEVCIPCGLVTYYVLFIIHLSTRSVHIAWVTTAPNAFAERFVRYIKEECLDRMILFSEASLRQALHEYGKLDTLAMVEMV